MVSNASSGERKTLFYFRTRPVRRKLVPIRPSEQIRITKKNASRVWQQKQQKMLPSSVHSSCFVATKQSEWQSRAFMHNAHDREPTFNLWTIFTSSFRHFNRQSLCSAECSLNWIKTANDCGTSFRLHCRRIQLEPNAETTRSLSLSPGPNSTGLYLHLCEVRKAFVSIFVCSLGRFLLPFASTVLFF